MSFCKFNLTIQEQNKTLVDNEFISRYMFESKEIYIKAYLLGLMMCSNADDRENSIEYFAHKLNLPADDVVSCFRYWEQLGLVKVLSTNPIEVRYLPVPTNNTVRSFSRDKYADFNIQVQEIFNRYSHSKKDIEVNMLMPNQLAELYNLMEHYHISEDALLQIIRYCFDLKGFNPSFKYCYTVARDWANEGILTIEQVNDKIEELGLIDEKMSLILSAMGSKRRILIEDTTLLNKWLNAYGFQMNVIIFVIKMNKEKKRRVDMESLDVALTKYYEMKIMSIDEIENYEHEKENLFSLAISINKELGIYYEDLTKEVEYYVVNWQNMGFDESTLKLIADNCFKSSVRTLEGFNSVINKLFKLGIVTTDGYLKYINNSLTTDALIKEVLDTLNLSRNVNNMDRNFYNTWTNNWKFDHDTIIYGASLSTGKTNALAYLNKILSNWNNQGVKTLSEAKKTALNETDSKNEQFIHNSYSKEQISSLIANLDEVEV